MATTDVKIATEAYTKYHRGDPLSDVELRVGAKVLSQTEQVLRGLGEGFRLPANDIMFTWRALEQFQEERKRP